MNSEDLKKTYTLDRIFRIGIAALVIYGLFRLFGYLSDVLMPFFVAVLLAYLVNPLVCIVQKKIKNRIAAVLTTLSGLVIVLSLLGFLIVPLMTKEIGNMGEVLSEFVSDSEVANRASKSLPPDLWKFVKEFTKKKEVQELFKSESVLTFAKTAVSKILPGLWGLFATTGSIILGLLGLTIIILYLVFLLFDYENARKSWYEILPYRYRESVKRFLEDFEFAMNRYFRAQALVAFLTGILFAIGFSIIGLPMAIVLGLFIGLLNMVPYLQIVGLIPAFVLCGFYSVDTGVNFWVVCGYTGLVFVIAQLIQDAVLVPRIMGKATGLRPYVILLAVSVWAKLLGFFGLLLAIPATCLIWAYYKRFLESIKKKPQQV